MKVSVFQGSSSRRVIMVDGVPVSKKQINLLRCLKLGGIARGGSYQDVGRRAVLRQLAKLGAVDVFGGRGRHLTDSQYRCNAIGWAILDAVDGVIDPDGVSDVRGCDAREVRS